MQYLNNTLATCLITVLCMFSFCRADDVKIVDLPKPKTTGGRPLMEVLRDRKSTREFSKQEIPLRGIRTGVTF